MRSKDMDCKDYWAGSKSARPSSQASTRSPSSASTMKRMGSPQSVRGSPSPFGDSAFGGGRASPSSARGRGKVVPPGKISPSEAWGNVTPMGFNPMGFADMGGFDGPGSGGSSPRDLQPEEEVEIPNWYRLDGESSIGKPLLPDFELYTGLHGGNGLWERRKAIVTWRVELAAHQESEARRVAELKWARKAKKEAEEKRRRDREQLQRRVEEDAIERKRRMLYEEEQKNLRLLEGEEQQRILAEKRERMHKPRPCKICTGSGKCLPCHGKGCNLTLFLAPTVTERTKSICGQLPRGCASCGGSGDSAWWGEFICGSGACQSCSGKGMVPAPPNGWPDCQ